MELLALPQNPTIEIVEDSKIVNPSKTRFIEANTLQVSLSHLKEDCIIPVFAKDNETTISHYSFINTVQEVLHEILGSNTQLKLDIRVSHVIKGRIPSAIGKPAKELLEHEKTIYYERMAFVFEIPEIYEIINGNRVNLCVGGVRGTIKRIYSVKNQLKNLKFSLGFKIPFVPTCVFRQMP